MKLAFVTGNKGKFHEVQHRLAPLGIDLSMVAADPVEIQADSLEEVCREKLADAARKVEGALILDDGGLFVRHLKDFPGVYSAYALRTIGAAGILKLMEGVNDRRAEFRCVIGFHRPEAEPQFFSGTCPGRIGFEIRGGGHGFGFDPIFIPDGDNRAFSEIPTEEKNKISHRGRALDTFVAHWRTPR